MEKYLFDNSSMPSSLSIIYNGNMDSYDWFKPAIAKIKLKHRNPADMTQEEIINFLLLKGYNKYFFTDKNISFIKEENIFVTNPRMFTFTVRCSGKALDYLLSINVWHFMLGKYPISTKSKIKEVVKASDDLVDEMKYSLWSHRTTAPVLKFDKDAKRVMKEYIELDFSKQIKEENEVAIDLLRKAYYKSNSVVHFLQFVRSILPQENNY